MSDGRKLYVVQGTIVVTAPEEAASDEGASRDPGERQGGSDAEQPSDTESAGAEANRG